MLSNDYPKAEMFMTVVEKAARTARILAAYGCWGPGRFWEIPREIARAEKYGTCAVVTGRCGG